MRYDTRDDNGRSGSRSGAGGCTGPNWWWPTPTGQSRRGLGSDGPFVATVAAATSAVVLVVAFGLLAAGVDWFWLAFPIGYGGVVPLTIAWARTVAGRDRESTVSPAAETATAPTDRTAALRDAYVAGEIDDEEFERRLETALAGDGHTEE